MLHHPDHISLLFIPALSLLIKMLKLSENKDNVLVVSSWRVAAAPSDFHVQGGQKMGNGGMMVDLS